MVLGSSAAADWDSPTRRTCSLPMNTTSRRLSLFFCPHRPQLHAHLDAALSGRGHRARGGADHAVSTRIDLLCRRRRFCEIVYIPATKYLSRCFQLLRLLQDSLDEQCRSLSQSRLTRQSKLTRLTVTALPECSPSRRGILSRLFVTVCACALLTLSVRASAQDAMSNHPSRTLRVVVPFGYRPFNRDRVLALAGTPREIVARTNAEIMRQFQTPIAHERPAADGPDLVADPPQRYAEFLGREIAKWAKVAKFAGAGAEQV